VTWDHPGERPWPFTRAIIQRVVVNITGEPYLVFE